MLKKAAVTETANVTVNILHPNLNVYILMKNHDNQNVFDERHFYCLLLRFIFFFFLFLFFPLRTKYEDLINSKVFLVLGSES